MKWVRNILFSTSRYPSILGAGGQQDMEFVRYLEWVWFKRCVLLFGMILAAGAAGLFAGIYYEEEVTSAGIWVWGIAWIYNGLLIIIVAVSTGIGILKALIFKAFFTEQVQVGQAAARSYQMYKK